MSKSGFRLSRLIVAGQGLPDADIPFERGFNVLTGPSNTGKSFIVECIDYMLGADERPGEDIQESKGYDTVFLELSTPADTVYTLGVVCLGATLSCIPVLTHTVLIRPPACLLSRRRQRRTRPYRAFCLASLEFRRCRSERMLTERRGTSRSA